MRVTFPGGVTTSKRHFPPPLVVLRGGLSYLVGGLGYTPQYDNTFKTFPKFKRR